MTHVSNPLRAKDGRRRRADGGESLRRLFNGVERWAHSECNIGNAEKKAGGAISASNCGSVARGACVAQKSLRSCARRPGTYGFQIVNTHRPRFRIVTQNTYGFTAAKRSTSAPPLPAEPPHSSLPAGPSALYSLERRRGAHERSRDSRLAPSRGVSRQAQRAGVSPAPSAEGRTSYPRQQ